MKETIILAIESSCDETSASIVKNGREVLSNTIYSQVAIHRTYGGVVPEIASRNHLEKISRIVDAALEEAGLTFDALDAVAVTYGPGLVGALLVGLSYAKALAFSLDVPLIGVNHIEGHIAANYIAHPELEPPFLTLVVSGGHTHLVWVPDYGVHEVLGRTRDDAVGEAFDKVARSLGLGYPGGPLIDRLSDEGNPEAVYFKRTYLEKGSLDFSFSGIKSGVLNYLNSMRMKKEPLVTADVAASFQASVVEVLVEKSMEAAERVGAKTLCLAGGVAANRALRKALAIRAEEAGITFHYPPMDLCTDNAAMIGASAYHQYQRGDFADLYLNAVPNLRLE